MFDLAFANDHFGNITGDYVSMPKSPAKLLCNCLTLCHVFGGIELSGANLGIGAKSIAVKDKGAVT